MIINRIFVRRYSEKSFNVPIDFLSSSSNTNSHFNSFMYQLDLSLKERVLFEEVNLFEEKCSHISVRDVHVQM